MNRPNLTAVEVFPVHGLQYVFPADRGQLARGAPASYAAEPLQRMIAPENEPIPGWPSASVAAPKNSRFHELLTLADALRSGRPRERKLAGQALNKRFRATQ